MSHNLSSLKGGYRGDYIGAYYRGHEGGYWEFRLWLIWGLQDYCVNGLGSGAAC